MFRRSNEYGDCGRGELLHERVATSDAISDLWFISNDHVIVPMEYSGPPEVSIVEARDIALEAMLMLEAEHRHAIGGIDEKLEYGGPGMQTMTHLFRVVCAACQDEEVVPGALFVEIDVMDGRPWGRADSQAWADEYSAPVNECWEIRRSLQNEAD